MDSVRRSWPPEKAAATALTPLEREALLPYTVAMPLYLNAIAGFMPDPAAHVLSLALVERCALGGVRVSATQRSRRGQLIRAGS
jgi:hypothetical protein